MNTVLLPYNTARTKIRDSELLLFRRRRGLCSRLIAVAGRTQYCHAAMAAWWNGRLAGRTPAALQCARSRNAYARLAL